MTAFRESYIRRLPSFALLSVVGYFVGLGFGIYMSHIVSQPGMVYINPAVVLGVLAACRYENIPWRKIILAP
jgi:glycerol uptake facilitator-like aquaporin